MIGHELGGRYEIITRIGGGGMALVYKAQDLLLNRFVAVKILRQQFVHDEEFIQRFRREAQSAASLSHPNVVSIYDVGQEDETHYIVMEYVEGSNLNEIIKERAPLQTEEAVRIASQICDALEHAHQNHIIHRDIKPHNILIGKNGRVKVTDFGIARAVTSSTITQTGSVVGSVHYFSPEHAKGVSTGEKSDLYSLGIVLYQMLTGRLPFLGESPISVALKHLQEDFEEPRAVNPHIPQSVENIILKSMRKNPGERYESAREMLRDLETCLDGSRLHEPKAVFPSDLDETRVMPAFRSRPEPPTAPPPAAAQPVPSRLSQAAAAAGAAAETAEDRWTETEQGKRRWTKPLLIVLGTLLLLALLFFGFRMVLANLDAPEVDVPYVVNQTEEKARQMLADKGLRVEEPPTYEHRDDFAKGIVFRQSDTNMRVKKGAHVKLFVSLGPELVTVADYTGMPYADVVTALTGLGVKQEQIESVEEYDDEKDPGTVISQTPPPDEQIDPKTARFTFTVSKGKEQFPMENLIGLTQKQALDRIGELGLVAGPDSGIVEKPSYKEEGTVIDQFPFKEGDPVSKGSAVTITVSSGYPEDAVKFTYNISISPAKAGQTSEIRIEYSDARGEKIEWGKRRINDTKSFEVELVLAPNSDATVTVYRDGQFADTFPVTYEEAKAGGTAQPASVAGESAPPPANEQPADNPDGDGTPGQTEGNGGDGQAGQDQDQDQQDQRDGQAGEEGEDGEDGDPAAP